MRRWPIATSLVVLALWTFPLQAQEGPQRGTIKKVTADAITIAVGGKDVECTLSADTRIMDTANQPVTPPIRDKGVKPGAAVMFLARPHDGKLALIGIRLLGAAASAGRGPGDIRRGKIKDLDIEGKTLRLVVNGKDEEFQLAEETQVLGATGSTLRERLQGINPGAEIFFKAVKRDGKATVVAMKPVEGGGRPLMSRADSSKLRPLTSLGKDKYQGYEGGLYPEGKNERPAAHEAAGLALAKQIRPLDAEGRPSNDGSIVLLSVGMSNTMQISQGFQQALENEREKNPRLVFVNGAQGGMTAAAIQDPEDHGRGTQYWTTVDERLKAAGVSRAQVQVVWIKQADGAPTQGFPAYREARDNEATAERDALWRGVLTSLGGHINN